MIPSPVTPSPGQPPSDLRAGRSVRALTKVPRTFADRGALVGTEVVIDRTKPVVDEFNRLMSEGRIVAAALHLTC